ncbi:hypothetical protein [Companilactobacillus sp.]|jgi:uncharacterized membrane protein YidH (DUF202 family)|uniref:hypothetical protein n=1 Tax=Companilactobacillus sp. TaxID=2767905 RepID=UPI0025BFF7BC|nr:hypothetical protein [Companilactobacillus sp.]MCH4008468.1 hypothetical protein [Companilactobacillus sp.]MCH4051353.1 hypothetical protein [Companilactobacillus sp.]MCH4076411.1 hypothetical protein [Companilactobacillus sp.]MCH4124986.1 hypothetical protein [Companilactobacillus sp.]MCH4131528.1 hypothetical protein [Companilactobacillus sp.]
MIIQILMVVFILFLLALAYNLWSHLDKKFLIYSPGENKRLQNAMKFTAILLVVISIVGVLILLFGSKEANFITLILGSITAASFSIYLGNIRG